MVHQREAVKVLPGQYVMCEHVRVSTSLACQWADMLCGTKWHVGCSDVWLAEL